MKKLISLFVILNFQLLCFSQSLFKLNYGGSHDYFFGVTQTADMGYIFMGQSTLPGTSNEEILLVKIDSAGVMEWSRTYGDTGMDWGMSIVNDGSGFIIAGGSEYQGTAYANVFLMKIDSVGNQLWTNYYPPSNHRGSAARCIIKTTNKEYVAGGDYVNGGSPMTYESDGYLLKMDSLGEVIWTKRFGGPDDEDIKIVRETMDGGYILAGDFMFVAKVDSGGNFEWSKRYFGDGLQFINSIELTADSGFIVAGTASFSVNDPKAFLLKLDASGNLSWAKLYGGSYSTGFLNAYQTADGGYLAGGGSDSNNFSRPIMIKTDANGDTLWTRDYLDTVESAVHSVIIDHQGNAVFSGENFGYHAGILKVNLEGDLPCLQREMSFTAFTPVIQVNEAYFSMTPESTFPRSSSLIIGNGTSTTTMCYGIIDKTDLVKSTNYFMVYPNPLVNDFMISVSSNDNFRYQMMNLLGEVILENVLTASDNHVLFDKYPAGIYLLRVFSSTTSSTKILVKQ